MRTSCCSGVVLALPPQDATERENHCKQGETHMWRLRSEAACPALAGDNTFSKQIPMSRALPMWAGISEQGVAEIVMHQSKKVSVDEWVDAIIEIASNDGRSQPNKTALNRAKEFSIEKWSKSIIAAWNQL